MGNRLVVAICLGLLACGAPPASDPTVEDWLEAELAADRIAWEVRPSEWNAVWVGRRLGYLGRHEEAVAWYRARLADHPDSHRLRRHLGHRLISLRRHDEAIEVLERARALADGRRNHLEADGAPNPTGEPRSTTHGNIDYHLALAYYLTGDLERAAEGWRRCLERWAVNDDGRVSAGHWLYTTLVRAGRDDEARALLDDLPADPDVIENHAYRDLIDLYAGRIGPDDPARGADDAPADAAWLYGLARWRIARGETAEGRELLEALAARGDASFGVLAAEADLARL